MQRQVLLLIALAACDRGDRGPTKGTSGDRTGPAYEVHVTPAPCKAAEACTVAVRLDALADYKVNDEYPFKFVPEATDGVTHDGHGFSQDGKSTGTMTVTFRAAAPGTVKVAGKLRLSVCNDDECLIEEAPVSVEVVVG